MFGTRVGVLAAFCIALVACSKNAETGGEESQAVTPVQTAPAVRETIRRTVNAQAILYPVKQAVIVPKISAPVARFLVQRGDHVKTGQLIAVLEDRDLAAATQESKELYEQARAMYQNTKSATMPEDLTKARTDVASARQGLDAARQVYESRQKLYREGALAEKLVLDAKVALVQAQSQFDTAEEHLKALESVGRAEQLKSAQAQMEAAKAHWESAQAQLSYAQVRSPISGIVADRPVNIGDMATAGSALMTIVDISQVVARANLPVNAAAQVRVGQLAAITAPGGEANGKVTVVSPAVNPSTTTLEIWITAPNANEQLKPGTTVNVSIDAGEIPDAIVVPVAALLSTEEGGEKVMVAGPDGLAHDRDVELGVRSGGEVQIVNGVHAGEQVITQGALGLEDKAKIEIVKPESEPAKDEGEKKDSEK